MRNQSNQVSARPTSQTTPMVGPPSGGSVRRYRREFDRQSVLSRGEPPYNRWLYINCRQGFHSWRIETLQRLGGITITQDVCKHCGYVRSPEENYEWYL